ncbi:leucyl/phenylalanyl-tRNA--protein transferase [Marinomonas sp. M1K-6]|uniref:Leucyl/phenylalanyl-tRNA--protein transferase n=1 Tax=Marinomonas profundi TaxID=2726122 RepID=A0A847R8V4_9GAMM|nr:leucyl/phenylalanyl-tRNA--protein transferase [Marinomonas profundi]NLQ16690.1 leucyl/phenylalanyl-tRNA--protein transferase [Marinomonas profundi]UDV03733.1 leucyl/phenylalanyl-tRNA--protein transferase [Marinomonas profundi]
MPDTAHDSQELILLSASPYDTPDPHKALQDPEGLAAVGGDLSTTRLIHLYSKGFFPWFSELDPILWWHPEQRCTLKPSHFHASKSLKKALKKTTWHCSVNQAFERVIYHCSALREDKEGTWISSDIKRAYTALHKLGYAHSIEVWQDNQLVGGFYGIAMGNMFFGESMFSLVPNASKIALQQFCVLAEKCDIELIDCQVESKHLLSLGAELMPRALFSDTLSRLIPTTTTNPTLLSIGEKAQKQPI